MTITKVWRQIHLQCSKSDVEIAETLLLEENAISISLADAGDQPLFEPLPGQSPLWDQVIVTGLFEAKDIKNFENTAHLIGTQTNANRVWTSAIDDKDWEREWMSHYKPIKCRNNLWIVPKWLTPPEPTAINIIMDPGLAFGTGYHATTRLCLDWLSEQDLSGKSVVDYGCGSGILGIACLLLGAEKVYSVDIDPQAVIATNQNAKSNHVDSRLEAYLPDDFNNLFERADIAKADVIVANILAKPLIQLAPYLSTLIKPKGLIVLSGLIEPQLDEVVDAYAPWFNIQSKFSFSNNDDNHWYRLSGTFTG